jgi:metal transporter CNNM
MLLTFPVSYIISKILDKLLGEEIGFVYNRENLKELITVTSDHNNLEADEVNIISGALTMRKKTVEDIMTPLEQIYMLPTDSLLDYNTLREIRTEGYSRIPIYENSRTNIVSVLQTKDLIFVDPDDCTPLHSLAAGHANECFFILGDTTLDVVFKEFNETKRGHMAFVQKIDSADEDRDPVFVTIGLITLEDVIEELIQYNRQIKD